MVNEQNNQQTPQLTDIPQLPKETVSSSQTVRNLRTLRSGRGSKSMGFGREGLAFGGETFAAAVLKLFTDGKIKLPFHDYGGGTTGFIESDTDLEDGMVYIAFDYGGSDYLRVRVNGAWVDMLLSGGTSSGAVKTRHSFSLSQATGSKSLPHGLGRVPTYCRIQGFRNGNFCDISWVATNNDDWEGLGWGNDISSNVEGYAWYIASGAAAIGWADSPTFDDTYLNFTYDKTGSPSGSVILYITVS